MPTQTSWFAATTARLFPVLSAGAILVCGAADVFAGPPLWKQLVPRKRVDANPQADYTLKEENGPWLVMAASFTGETGAQQARDLVLELRGRYNLPAYYYGMTFDLDDENAGRGIDANGAKIKHRLQRGDEVLQHAVLVGEFSSIEDEEAQELLDQVKTMQPKTLSVDATETSQTLAGVREFYTQTKRQMGQQVPAGPMTHAFLTRNPKLPREYFVPGTVDPDVAKWNKDVPNSLLYCPGRYSIRVATFRGRTALEGAKGAPSLTGGTRQATDEDPLVIAANQANQLCAELRKERRGQPGWEAYVMHDRHESYVTIGSFKDATRLPNGGLVINDRNAQIIFNTFSATTPNNSLMEQGAADPREVAMRKQRFQELFAKNGKAADGFNPKSFAGIPFDIVPQPVEVPHEALTARFARN